MARDFGLETEYQRITGELSRIKIWPLFCY